MKSNWCILGKSVSKLRNSFCSFAFYYSFSRCGRTVMLFDYGTPWRSFPCDFVPQLRKLDNFLSSRKISFCTVVQCIWCLLCFKCLFFKYSINFLCVFLSSQTFVCKSLGIYFFVRNDQSKFLVFSHFLKRIESSDALTA